MAPKRSRKRKAEVPEPDPWNDSWNGEEEDPWAHETHQNQSEDPWRFVAEDDVPADGDSMLVENPWASNPGSKLTTHNSQIHLDAALRLASDLAPIAKEASQYDTNGACPKRLGCVLSSNCKRKHCARPGCKAGVISHQEVCSFMEKWVKLPLPDRSHLLRCNYYQDNSVIARDAEAVKETVEWHMCGYAICFQRFCEILGSSQRTVRRLISGQPDLRLSKSGFGSQSRAAVQTAKCDHFFRTLHASAAEPMPEEAQMYPKAKQLGSHSGVQVSRSSGVQKRDMTSIDAWEHWSYDWLSMPPADVQAAEKAHCGTLGLPIRYIQHQRLIDLYWQFTAEWDIHVERNPGDGECPAFQTFAKRYYSHWRYVLVMRKISQHGQCKTCFDFHSVLRSPKADWSTKVPRPNQLVNILSVLFIHLLLMLMWQINHFWATPAKIRAARSLREHQRHQYLDRTLYWGLRFSAVHDQEVLTVIIDGMGKWGTAWPHLGQDKPSKELDNIVRPKLVITAALCHGWGTFLFGTSELENHGAEPC